jgi:hypothetical protein
MLLRFPLLLALAVLLSPLVVAQPVASDPPVLSVFADTPFRLAPGESGTVSPYRATIRFDGVSQDSRCPADVVCVWAGRAVVHVTVFEADGTAHEEELTLVGGTSGRASVEVAGRAEAAGFMLHLLQLSPYPRTNSPLFQPVEATFLLGRLAE